jgi:hypothetical protein
MGLVEIGGEFGVGEGVAKAMFDVLNMKPPPERATKPRASANILPPTLNS